MEATKYIVLQAVAPHIGFGNKDHFRPIRGNESLMPFIGPRYIFTFSALFTHSHFANAMIDYLMGEENKKFAVVSGGFIRVSDNGKVECVGKSISCRVESHPSDIDLLDSLNGW